MPEKLMPSSVTCDCPILSALHLFALLSSTDNYPTQRAWKGHQDEPAQTHFKLLFGALSCPHLNCFLVELPPFLFNANLIPFLWTATLPPTLPTPLPLKLPEPFFTLSLKAATINKSREAAGIPGEAWGHCAALWEHRWALLKSNSLFHALTSLCYYPHLRQYFCLYCGVAPWNAEHFQARICPTLSG